MPTDLIQHIFDLIISCDTVKYVIMYPHGPVTVDRLVALGEVRWGFWGGEAGLCICFLSLVKMRELKKWRLFFNLPGGGPYFHEHARWLRLCWLYCSRGFRQVSGGREYAR